MTDCREDLLFLRYQKTGDPDCLGEAFDRTAPKLLRTALHLAVDPAQAEDLLQATFLTAIQKAESFDTSRPLLPWLTGILTRHAARARERAARRPDPDKLGTKTSADPSSGAERDELVELLRTRVERLPEEYRQALLLKLLHGLEPAEIAEVLAVPPGTVRMRLHRGMEKLRRIMPVGLVVGTGLGLPLRGLAGVRRAIVKRAALPTSALAPIGATLLMKKTLLPATLVAGLAVLWLGWSVLLPEPMDATTGTAASDPLSSKLWDEDRSVALETDPTSPGRTSIVSREAQQQQSGSLLLLVRHEATLRPASHVGVFLTPLDGRDPVLNQRQGVTEKDGLLLVADLPPGPVEVKLDRLVNETVRIEAGKQTDIALMVPTGIAVEGRVMDQLGGRVPYANVWLRQQTVGWPSSVVATANAFGEFRLEGLSPYTQIGATAPGHAPSYMHPVIGDPGDTVKVEVTLEGPGATMEGRVLDVLGNPVPNALVLVGGDVGGRAKQVSRDTRLGGWCARRLRTDEEGSFHVKSLPAGWLLMNVRAFGMAPYSEYFELTPSRLNQVVIQLRTGTNLRGRVIDARGEPVSGASIAVETYGRYEEASTLSTSAGSYHLQGLAPDRIKVSVSAEGYSTASQLFVGSSGDELKWDVQLTDQGVLEGRIVGPEGEPLRGWLVMLSGGSHMRSSDVQGRFFIRFESELPQELRLSPPERGGWIVCDWLGALAPRDETDELTIRVPAEAMPRAFLRGALLTTDGAPRTDRGIIYAEKRWLTRSFDIDPESGAFQIGPISSGSYWIELWASGRDSAPVRLGPYRVVNGQDLDLGELRLPKPGTVRVSISRSDGVPLDDPYAYFFDSEDREFALYPYVDETGHLRQSLLPGRYTVHVMPSNASWATTPFVVRSGGETEVHIVLEPAIRRYVSFPVPLPEGWGHPERVHAVIRNATGGLVDTQDYDPRDRGQAQAYTTPFRYAPALGVGRHTLDLTLDDGQRYRGTFEVPDLRPSQVPIKVSVTPIR